MPRSSRVTFPYIARPLSYVVTLVEKRYTTNRAPSMAFPHKTGLLPAEIAFICEMELVTIVPRQRLESLELLGVSAPCSFPAR